MENTTIGELLKSSREAQNLSLKEVSQKTKININILRHLEANRISELPNKTYVRGFVKTYAKLVGIADQDAISSLDFTYGDLSGSEKLFAPKIQEEDEEKAKKEETKDIQNNIKSIVSSMIDKRVLYGIATIVLIVLIGKAVGSFFNQLSNEQVKMVKKEKVIEPKAIDGLAKTDWNDVLKNNGIKSIQDQLGIKRAIDKVAEVSNNEFGVSNELYSQMKKYSAKYVIYIENRDQNLRKEIGDYTKAISSKYKEEINKMRDRARDELHEMPSLHHSCQAILNKTASMKDINNVGLGIHDSAINHRTLSAVETKSKSNRRSFRH